MRENHFLFILFSLFWIFLGWLGFLSALAGFFYPFLFFTYLIVGISIIFYFLLRYRKKLNLSPDFLAVALFSLVIIIIFSFFTTPTIFTGRDQGSFSEAAIRLAQNHQLEFSSPVSKEFFQIYGPGKALNFPGFHYQKNGELISQFPLVYIAWLGIFYSFFGLSGLIIANAILLFLFLLSFYSLLRLYGKKSTAFLLLFFTIFSFSFSWFFKLTLSENMALTLFWFCVFSFVLFLKQPRALSYTAYLTTAFLLSFTRIEGLAFLLVGVTILFFYPQTRKFFQDKKFLKIFFPFLFWITIFSINIAKNIYFYKEIIKGFLSSYSPSLNTFSFWKNYPIYFGNELVIFFLYGLLGFFILGTIGIFFFAKQKKYSYLWPFFLAFPSLIYLINPHISSDHPWMLRRFVFSLLPLFIFYSVLFLDKLFRDQTRKIFAKLITLLLFFSLLPSFFYFIFFTENKNLLRQIENLSLSFSEKDLVLIDRLSAGDGWTLISGPLNFLYGKNAVYFFNPKDLDKLNRARFEKIYLIAPKKNSSFWKKELAEKNLIAREKYSLRAPRLEIKKETSILTFPAKKEEEINGIIWEITDK